MIDACYSTMGATGWGQLGTHHFCFPFAGGRKQSSQQKQSSLDIDRNPLSLQRLPELLAQGLIGSFPSSMVNGAKKLSRNEALAIGWSNLQRPIDQPDLDDTRSSGLCTTSPGRFITCA